MKETVRELEALLEAKENEISTRYDLADKARREYERLENRLIEKYEENNKKVYRLMDVSDPHFNTRDYIEVIIPELLDEDDQLLLKEAYDKRFSYDNSTLFDEVDKLKKKIAIAKDAERGITPKKRKAIDNIKVYKRRLSDVEYRINQLNEQLEREQKLLTKYQEKLNEYQEMIKE